MSIIHSQPEQHTPTTPQPVVHTGQQPSTAPEPPATPPGRELTRSTARRAAGESGPAGGTTGGWIADR